MTCYVSGSINITIHIHSSMSFQAYFKNVSWFVKAVLVRTLYFTFFLSFFLYIFDSSSPVHKLLSGKAGWKPRWRSRTHWRDNVSWLAWERSLKVTMMSNLPHSWVGHSIWTVLYSQNLMSASPFQRSQKKSDQVQFVNWNTYFQLYFSLYFLTLAAPKKVLLSLSEFILVSCEASTQQSSTTGQFVHPNALLMSRCWQSAVRNSLNPSWNPSFVNGTYLYETVSLRSVTEGPLIIRTQDVLCRGRGAGGATLRPHTRWNTLSNSTFANGRQKNWSEWVWSFFFFSLVYLPLKTRIDKSHCLNMRDSMWCQFNKNNIKHLDRKRT